jgi:hypothetical protein
MKFSPITERKLGSIEVLLFVILFEVIRGNFLGTLVYAGITIAFWLGRAHFKEDFSLAQLYGLFTTDKQEKQKS